MKPASIRRGSLEGWLSVMINPLQESTGEPAVRQADVINIELEPGVRPPPSWECDVNRVLLSNLIAV